jgi:hypothetical protein
MSCTPSCDLSEQLDTAAIHAMIQQATAALEAEIERQLAPLRQDIADLTQELADLNISARLASLEPEVLAIKQALADPTISAPTITTCRWQRLCSRSLTLDRASRLWEAHYHALLVWHDAAAPGLPAPPQTILVAIPRLGALLSAASEGRHPTSLPLAFGPDASSLRRGHVMLYPAPSPRCPFDRGKC